MFWNLIAIIQKLELSNYVTKRKVCGCIRERTALLLCRIVDGSDSRQCKASITYVVCPGDVTQDAVMWIIRVVAVRLCVCVKNAKTMVS